MVGMYYIYSQSQCKFGKVMFKLTSIFPPLSLSGSSTYSSFTLQDKSKRSEPAHNEAHLHTAAAASSPQLQREEHLCRLSLSNFPPVTSSPGHPLLPAVRLTHCTGPISCQISDSNHWWHHRRTGGIITGTPAGTIKSAGCMIRQRDTYISVAMNPVSSDRKRKSMKTQQRMETVGKQTLTHTLTQTRLTIILNYRSMMKTKWAASAWRTDINKIRATFALARVFTNSTINNGQWEHPHNLL